MRRQRGIALILVLMVTGILGLLMLQVGLTAREHVARAQRLSDRAEAELLAQSREAAMAFTLLTQPWVERPPVEGAPSNPYAAAWNFRGAPFEVDGVTYRLQDASGLLPLPQPDSGTRAFVALLGALEVDPQRAERLGVQLQELLGTRPAIAPPGGPAPRRAESVRAQGFPLQSVAELRFLPDMDEALLARLEYLTTLYPAPGFNPLTAPPEVLATRFSGSMREGIEELRRQGRLDASSLFALAGIEADDATTLSAGPALRIGFELRHAGIAVRRETTLVVRPFAAEPLGLWSRRTLPEAGA